MHTTWQACPTLFSTPPTPTQYKYDIPVVTANDSYWFKHRFPKDVDWEGEIRQKVKDGGGGEFESIGTEPDAGRMERKRECKECGD